MVLAGGNLAFLSDIRQRIKSRLQILVRRDVVAHSVLKVGGVGSHIEVAGTGQAEENDLLFACLAAADGFVDRAADGVRALRSGEDRLETGEERRGLKDLRLLHGAGFVKIAVVEELRENRAHAMVAQTAGVVRGRNEAAAERVHPRQRRDLAGVAEIVGIFAARERGTGGGLHRNEVRIRFAEQLILHERGNQAAEVRSAARASNHNVRVLADDFHCRLALQADDRLVQQHLVEHAAEHIAASGGRGRLLDGFRNSAAETAGRIRILRKDGAADARRIARACHHIRAKGLHDGLAVRLLVVRALHHENVQVQAKVRACLRERRAPLACARLGRQARQALLLRVVRLRDGGVQLVAAGGVAAFKFIIDMRRGVQVLLKIIRTAQRRGTVSLVQVEHRLRNIEIARRAVRLLLCELLAEDGVELFGLDGLERCRVEKRIGLLLHVGAQVVPLLRHLVLGENQSVGNLRHGNRLLFKINFDGGLRAGE